MNPLSALFPNYQDLTVLFPQALDGKNHQLIQFQLLFPMECVFLMQICDSIQKTDRDSQHYVSRYLRNSSLRNEPFFLLLPSSVFKFFAGTLCRFLQNDLLHKIEFAPSIKYYRSGSNQDAVQLSSFPLSLQLSQSLIHL